MKKHTHMKPSTLVLTALVLTALVGCSLLPQTADAAVYAIDSGTAALAIGETQELWSAAALNHFTAVAGS